MSATTVIEWIEAPVEPQRRRWRSVAWRSLGNALEYGFGLISLVLGLSILAALPVVQFLSLGYLFESSARVARSGKLRHGLIGVRKASKVGGLVAGVWLSFGPLWIVSSLARSAQLIDPGGSVARGWEIARGVLLTLTVIHVTLACARGGRFRDFVWPPIGFVWLFRSVRLGGLYVRCRDGLWEFVAALHLARYFRLGLVGYLGTLVWLAVPSTLIAMGGAYPLVGILGSFGLVFVASWLPFLQVGFAVEDRVGALFGLRAIRDRYQRAPWAFASALMALLLAAIPLYLLKIEVIPRDAAWLPSLVFIVFLYPARVLVGWAYARSEQREHPRHWLGRVLGRIAIIPTALLYVLVVFLAQYTSWGGTASLFEQHAFLLPVPFLNP